MIAACSLMVVSFLFTLTSAYTISTNLPTNLNIIEAIDTPLTTLFLLGLFLILIGITFLLNYYNIKF